MNIFKGDKNDWRNPTFLVRKNRVYVSDNPADSPFGSDHGNYHSLKNPDKTSWRQDCQIRSRRIQSHTNMGTGRVFCPIQGSPWNAGNIFVKDRLSIKKAGSFTEKDYWNTPPKIENSILAEVPSKIAQKRYHTVTSGETLFSISHRYGLPVEKIRHLNKLTDASVIHPGQRLLLSL